MGPNGLNPTPEHVLIPKCAVAQGRDRVATSLVGWVVYHTLVVDFEHVDSVKGTYVEQLIMVGKLC